MKPELALVALFSISAAVAVAARRFKVPYTVSLVLAGLALGSIDAFEVPHLTKDLLYAVFLPGLVFEAAFALEASRLRENAIAVGSLAVPGLVLSIGLTAAILSPVASGLGEPFGWAEGLVFGAAIAATDPIAVVALFKSLGAPKRLAVLIEGESLLNDGTAVVVFSLVLSAVLGGSFSPGGAILGFVRIVGMGALIGAVIGYAVSLAIHGVDDAMIEITLTTIAAYGSFVAAEHFHFSGVIATVVAGMFCGNYAARTGMSPSTRVAVSTFWEYLAFALNSLVFLLIGFEVELSTMLAAWQPILVAFVAVLVARGTVVYAAGMILRRTRERFPLSWAGVLTWGGLRGGLSMVLVLGLPQEMPHRELIVSMTFGVVVLSILVQGVSMGPLLRRLGIVADRSERREHERLRGVVQSAKAGAAEVDRMLAQGVIATPLADELRESYEKRLADGERALSDLHVREDTVREEDRKVAQRRAILAERDAVMSALRAGVLRDESAEPLLADIDARLVENEDAG